ncbi:MAG: hypothetical protein Q7T05_08915, partial [Dehalococcoidia bacterium]|nr:hypothetical protein [Dehalococcoidia bacterium]
MIDSAHYITSYTYDGANNVVTLTYPTGETVTQGYDGAERPATLSGSAAGTLVCNTLYNQLGSMSEIDLGNGLNTVFKYHGIDTLEGGEPANYYGKLYRIETFLPATPPDPDVVRQDQRYWWDASGNLAVRTDAVASETENFTYDFLDRLATASGPYSQTYAYDILGNITDFNGTAYTYGTKPHAVTSVGAYTQSYDANGNMTGRANATGTQ